MEADVFLKKIPYVVICTNSSKLQDPNEKKRDNDMPLKSSSMLCWEIKARQCQVKLRCVM